MKYSYKNGGRSVNLEGPMLGQYTIDVVDGRGLVNLIRLPPKEAVLMAMHILRAEGYTGTIERAERLEL